MRYCFRGTTLLAVAVLLIMSVGVWAADDTAKPIKLSALAERQGSGVIDWGAEMLYATGEGAMPTPQEEPNRARAKLKARDYAKMDAISNLLMLIEGTSISYEATGKDYMADAAVRQKIEGYVKNVEVLREERVTEEGMGIIRVTVGTRMYGPQTPGTALLLKMCEVAAENPEPAPVKVEIPAEPPKPAEVKPAAPKPAETKTVVVKPAEAPKPAPKPVATKPAAPEKASPQKTVVVAKVDPEPVVVTVRPKPVAKPAPKPAEPVKPVETPKPAVSEAKPAAAVSAKPAETVAATAVVSNGPYTSVIVNTIGLKVMRAMSPKIRTQDGSEVWGTLKMDPDEVQDHGPVAYTRSMEDARKCPRAGSTPLEIKAIGRAGGSRMCDVVLSDEDVARLKQADQSAKPPFLAQLKVVFVVDAARAF